MGSQYYPVRRKAPESYTTEFDILKASHKFLRSEDKDAAKTWDAQLAKKYEDSLFKEFAVCDLKHYKSGNIALRWRTEDEVLSGAGEETCGNTRCPYHDSPGEPTSSRSQDAHLRSPRLTTMELPFSYVEQGETDPREAMVKVVLCERCVKKLMWKREKDKKDRPGATYPEEQERMSQEKRTKESERTNTDSGEQSRHRLRVKAREHPLAGEGCCNRNRSMSPRRRLRSSSRPT